MSGLERAAQSCWEPNEKFRDFKLNFQDDGKNLWRVRQLSISVWSANQ